MARISFSTLIAYAMVFFVAITHIVHGLFMLLGTKQFYVIAGAPKHFGEFDYLLKNGYEPINSNQPNGKIYYFASLSGEAFFLWLAKILGGIETAVFGSIFLAFFSKNMMSSLGSFKRTLLILAAMHFVLAMAHIDSVVELTELTHHQITAHRNRDGVLTEVHEKGFEQSCVVVISQAIASLIAFLVYQEAELSKEEEQKLIERNSRQPNSRLLMLVYVLIVLSATVGLVFACIPLEGVMYGKDWATATTGNFSKVGEAMIALIVRTTGINFFFFALLCHQFVNAKAGARAGLIIAYLANGYFITAHAYLNAFFADDLLKTKYESKEFIGGLRIRGGFMGMFSMLCFYAAYLEQRNVPDEEEETVVAGSVVDDKKSISEKDAKIKRN